MLCKPSHTLCELCKRKVHKRTYPLFLLQQRFPLQATDQYTLVDERGHVGLSKAFYVTLFKALMTVC